MKAAKILIVFIFLLAFNNCSSNPKQLSVTYLIPKHFEGAIVIFYNETNGINPALTDEGYVLTIPNEGVLKIQGDRKKLGGIPSFFLIGEDGSRKKLEYLYTTTMESQINSGRTELDVSDYEKENQVFAMNYDNFNISAADIYGKSFLVCKIKDGNLFASRDLPEKITGF